MAFATRLAALYAACFAMSGVQLPFFPVWLKAEGLEAATIGLALALPMLVRFAAIPLAAGFADRREALRATLIGIAALNLAGYALLGKAAGAGAILAATALASFFYTPLMPLIDAYALKGLAARGRAYGPVRLWGSAAFTLGTLAAGFATDVIDARNLVWIIVAGAGLTLAAAVSLSPLPPSQPAAEQGAARPHLLRDRGFLTIAIAASLIQASHALYYGFSALAWRAQGFDGLSIGALWTLGVLAEIVLFALQARLPAFVTPRRLLLIGAAGAALRWSAMALDPPALALPLLQLLHAASFGATHLGTLMLIVQRAPAGQAARAQGYFAMLAGAAMAAASAAAGFLYGSFGAAAYGAMALAAVVGGACVLADKAAPRALVPR